MPNILTLNDCEELLESVDQLLKDEGYQSFATADEQEALAILRAQPIDLFIQDVMHPGRGGWGLLRQMKSDPALRHIPVLMMSSAPKESQRDVVRVSGLDMDRDLIGYLNLPFEVPEFLAALHRVFD